MGLFKWYKGRVNDKLSAEVDAIGLQIVDAFKWDKYITKQTTARMIEFVVYTVVVAVFVYVILVRGLR